MRWKCPFAFHLLGSLPLLSLHTYQWKKILSFFCSMCFAQTSKILLVPKQTLTGTENEGPRSPPTFGIFSIKFDREMMQRSWKQFQIEKKANIYCMGFAGCTQLQKWEIVKKWKLFANKNLHASLAPWKNDSRAGNFFMKTPIYD
jgi:hypothetical protein